MFETVQSNLSDHDKEIMHRMFDKIDFYGNWQKIVYLLTGATVVLVGLISYVANQPAVMIAEAPVLGGAIATDLKLRSNKKGAVNEAIQEKVLYEPRV